MATNDPNDPKPVVDDADMFHVGPSGLSISAGSDGKLQDDEVDPMVQKEAEDDDANTVEAKKDEEEHLMTPADQAGKRLQRMVTPPEVEIMSESKGEIDGRADTTYDQNVTQPMDAHPVMPNDAKLSAEDLGRASDEDKPASVLSDASINSEFMDSIMRSLNGIASRIDGLERKVEEVVESQSQRKMPEATLNQERERKVGQKVQQYGRVLLKTEHKDLNKINLNKSIDQEESMDGGMDKGLEEKTLEPLHSRPEQPQVLIYLVLVPGNINTWYQVPFRV